MNEITRSAEVIAAEINGIKAHTRTMMLCSSIEIGRRLAEAKLMLEHGQWGEWLQHSVDYSKSTANNLMRIFEEYGADQTALFGEDAKLQALGNLTYTQAVALLGVPAEEREAFAEQHDVAEMSTRELQAAIKAQKEAEKRAADAEERATAAASELAALAKESKQREKEMKQLQKNLVDAKKNGVSEEQVSILESQLEAAQAEVAKLNEQIAQPVTLEPVVIEKVPPEIEAELESLRAKSKSAGAPAAIVKYKVQFDAVIAGFNALLATLDEFTDETDREKYRGAAGKLLGRMQEQLAGDEA